MIREREANSDKPPTAYLESLEGKRMISWLCYRADGKAFLAAYHTVNHNVIEEWYLGEERPRFRKEVIKHRITSATIKTVSELRERRIEADKASKLESLTLFNTLADKSQIRSELEQTDFTQEEIDTILKYAETITNLQISFVCYCPDEQKILLIRQEIGSEESEGGGKSIIEEWQREPWTYLREYEGTYPKISSVRYSPDGAKILAANQHLVLEWDTAEHVAPPRVYPGFPPFAQVTSIDYSADGTRILAGGTDNTMREWDANIEECHNTIEDIFGLFIQGVNLTNARFEPEISDEEKKLLNRFGGRNLK
jgi:WD40 repeat protein